MMFLFIFALLWLLIGLLLSGFMNAEFKRIFPQDYNVAEFILCFLCGLVCGPTMLIVFYFLGDVDFKHWDLSPRRLHYEAWVRVTDVPIATFIKEKTKGNMVMAADGGILKRTLIRYGSD